MFEELKELELLEIDGGCLACRAVCPLKAFIQRYQDFGGGCCP